MKLSSKLLLGNLFVASLVVVTSSAALLANSSIQDAVRAAETASGRAELIERLEAQLTQAVTAGHEIVAARQSQVVFDLIGGDATKAATAYAQFSSAERALREAVASATTIAARWDAAAAPESSARLSPAVATLSRNAATLLGHTAQRLELARKYLKEELEQHYRKTLLPAVAMQQQRMRAQVASQQLLVSDASTRSTTQLLWAALATVVLAIGAALLLVRLLVKPLTALRDAALALGSGQLDRRIQSPGTDEIGDASRAFNEMGDALQEGRRALEDARRATEEKAALLEAQGSDLARARDAALDATRLKSEFLANMSHEIRTPLNGIAGTIELLRQTELDPDQSRFLGFMQASSETLLSVISDILDLSKIEAGKLEMSREPFSLRRALTQTLQALYVRARQKGLELLLDMPVDVPDAVIGDPLRLRQVLLNLVGNAVKFTERGEILVRVRAEQSDNGGVVARFAIRDTGIGIPRDKLALLFQPFVQVDGSSTRRFGGSGLGLVIATKLVEMLGGEISVDSVAGVGSVFEFNVRLERGAEDEPGVRQTRPALGRRVLVLDNNATSTRLLGEWLAGWRMKADPIVDSAEVPTALARAQRRGEPYDLLLFDADRPARGGLRLLEALRESGTDTPCLVLGSGLTAGEAQRALALKAGYLTKPVTPSALLDAMQTSLHPEGFAAATTSAPSNDEHEPPLRILLAEDNPINSALASELCRRRGHDVVAVPDGRAAVDAHQSGNFDVLLVDLQMPLLDGFGVTAAIRAREQQNGEHLPIFALTAHAMQGYRERCLAAGMDGYLSKPLDTPALVDVLQAVARARSETYRAHARGERPSSPTPSPVPFDLAGLTRRLGGDSTLAARLIALYHQHGGALIGAVERALEAGECKQLEGASHDLKGALRTLGATHAASVVARVEDRAVEGDLQGAQSAWRVAQEALASLAATLPEPLVMSSDEAHPARARDA